MSLKLQLIHVFEISVTHFSQPVTMCQHHTGDVLIGVHFARYILYRNSLHVYTSNLIVLTYSFIACDSET